MNSSVPARLSADQLEENYERWLDDPRSVEPTWSAFFDGFELGTTQLKKLGATEGNGAAAPVAPSPPASPDHALDAEQLSFRGRVVSLVYNYRTLGHTQAHINPLDEHPPRNPPIPAPVRGPRSSEQLRHQGAGLCPRR